MDNSDNRKRAAKQQSEEGGEEGKEAKLARTTSLKDSNDSDNNDEGPAGTAVDEGPAGTVVDDEGPAGTAVDEGPAGTAVDDEGGLSQEDEKFLSDPLFQNNGVAERKAINGVVEEVQDSQSQGELSQQSQDVLQAIESHECDRDERVVQEVQEVEYRLTNPRNAPDRIGRLYIELLRFMGENSRNMLINLKRAIQTMVTSTTAKAMFEQINEHVVPLVRTVATDVCWILSWFISIKIRWWNYELSSKYTSYDNTRFPW
jgi:hypothetical protein